MGKGKKTSIGQSRTGFDYKWNQVSPRQGLPGATPHVTGDNIPEQHMVTELPPTDDINGPVGKEEADCTGTRPINFPNLCNQVASSNLGEVPFNAPSFHTLNKTSQSFLCETPADQECLSPMVT